MSLTRRLRRAAPAVSREFTLNTAERNEALAAWNVKVLGSAIASQFYEAGMAGVLAPLPTTPVTMGFGGRLCRQEDIEAHWLRHWCRELSFVPMYHRKVWEDCYVLQQLHERGMLEPGRRGLGFAVGAEWLPSYFATRGVRVLATDLDSMDLRAQQWIAVDQHGGGIATLFKPTLVEIEIFDEHVQLRAVDMNAIPPDLHGQFDFLWSICSFEHCGTLEAGMTFAVEAMKCLRPGGIAVHTTEFNIDASGPTLESGGTVLYQRAHIEELGQRLAAAGHRMLPVDYGTGAGLMDQFVDLPPYPNAAWPMPIPEAPHLRLSVGGLVATSIGLVIEGA